LWRKPLVGWLAPELPGEPQGKLGLARRERPSTLRGKLLDRLVPDEALGPRKHIRQQREAEAGCRKSAVFLASRLDKAGFDVIL
jgi:hypothetical protein